MKQHDKEEKYDDVAIRALLHVLNNLDKFMEMDKTDMLRGEKHPRASITDDIAREIRYRTQVECESPKSVSKALGVHLRTVYRIKNEEGWTHI